MRTSKDQHPSSQRSPASARGEGSAKKGPNQKWAGGISYIWTSEGWLYLAVILDLYSRRVIGWAVSNRMKRDLAVRALDMTVALLQPLEGCIHHTDRGSQYCSNDYQRRLSKHGFKVSMSGKGNCYDNSMVETFFKSITLIECKHSTVVQG